MDKFIQFLLPRYSFLMIDHRTEQVLVTKNYYTKIHALHCLEWHTKLTNQFKYRVIDTKTSKEISLQDYINV